MVFPESFSEAGFSFRFRGPGVGARPRDAEPHARFFLCAGCGVRACRSAPVQARVQLRALSLVKLVCFLLLFLRKLTARKITIRLFAVLDFPASFFV